MERVFFLDSEKIKLHELLIMIMKEIDRICVENDIKYTISDGTLLGAIRHKGFIPWDDDFDISMKRDQYNKFIEACKESLDKEKFFLQTSDTEDKYGFAFAKIKLNGTEIIEDFSKNVPVHHGIFIDVFPFDNFPDGKWQSKIILKKNHILKNLIWVKCGYGTDEHKRSLNYKITKIISSFLSLKVLRKMRYRNTTKYNDVTTKLTFSSDYPRCKYDAYCWEEFIPLKFEDEFFMATKHYDRFLTIAYGDYMKLPPVEKRISHSNCKINFGKYK